MVKNLNKNKKIAMPRKYQKNKFKKYEFSGNVKVKKIKLFVNFPMRSFLLLELSKKN